MNKRRQLKFLLTTIIGLMALQATTTCSFNPSKKQAAMTAFGFTDCKFTQQDVQDRYKALALQWHPDKNIGYAPATEEMQRINNYKEILLKIIHGAKEQETKTQCRESHWEPAQKKAEEARVKNFLTFVTKNKHRFYQSIPSYDKLHYTEKLNYKEIFEAIQVGAKEFPHARGTLQYGVPAHVAQKAFLEAVRANNMVIARQLSPFFYLPSIIDPSIPGPKPKAVPL